MFARRTLHFTTTIAAMRRASRSVGVVGMLNASWTRVAAERAAKPDRALADALGFNRSAIMAAAVAFAHARRDVGARETWAELMSRGLRGAWQAARAARIRAAH